MGPVLNGLIKLQEVENRLRGMKSRLVRSKRAVTFQENQLRNLVNSLEAKKHEIQLTKSEIDNLELDLKSRDESLQKYRIALNTARNNKEYAAILTEINLSKADNTKLEGKILELMKNVEQEESSCEELKAEITTQEEKLEGVKEESAKSTTTIQEDLDQIQQEWDLEAKNIPAESLLLFKRLADSYDGEALAFVEKVDTKKSIYSCSGCYMKLTNETINQLLSKDEVIQCPSCSRIVVLGESFEQ